MFISFDSVTPEICHKKTIGDGGKDLCAESVIPASFITAKFRRAPPKC